MKIALFRERTFTGDLYVMIQYSNDYWMRVANESAFECDNIKYINDHFPLYSKWNGVLGDRVNVWDSQMKGNNSIAVKEIPGEVPEFKIENFNIYEFNKLKCNYKDKLCRMENIDMEEYFPEMSKEMKATFYSNLNAAKNKGGELIHISNKGMGKVKLPGGSLVYRGKENGKAILPDGTVAKSETYGSGRDFGYSWTKTKKKINSDSPDFDWWNWIVVTGEKSLITAVFGCRNGEADEL